MAIDIRKPASLALGAALLGGLAAPAFAMTDLAQGYALGAATTPPPAAEKQAATATGQASDTGSKQHAEGKCGEGKCGADKAAASQADADKAAAGKDKAHAEGKCGEGKCGGKH